MSRAGFEEGSRALLTQEVPEQGALGGPLRLRLWSETLGLERLFKALQFDVACVVWPVVWPPWMLVNFKSLSTCDSKITRRPFGCHRRGPLVRAL